MNTMSFEEYLQKLENMIIDGIATGKLGKVEMLSVRQGKLAVTAFGKKIGEVHPHEISFAIDYYGHYKKSKGFLKYHKGKYMAPYQIRGIQTTVVHFASLRIEDIAALGTPSLIMGFPAFKAALLQLRGLRKGGANFETISDSALR
jgi:hypothetical protein